MFSFFDTSFKASVSNVTSLPLRHASAAPITLNQILQNCLPNLQFNFIFEINNEIWQQLNNKCCLFSLNSIKTSLFLRLDQPETRTSNDGCSDSLNLRLGIGSFAQKVGLCLIERPYWVLQFSPFKTTWVTRLGYSIVFVWRQSVTSFWNVLLCNVM